MTASWAAVAGCKPSQPSCGDAAAPQVKVEAIGRTAVVDANALIMGAPLTTVMADRVVTVPEVLEEVRDKRSRQALAALPYTIETIEPVEDSISAVMRFARATGELHSLSSVDIKLIALAHMLEVAAHGADHLQSEPAPPRTYSKASKSTAKLAGWGETGADWAAIDLIEDENTSQDPGAEAASKVSASAQPLEDASAASHDGGRKGESGGSESDDADDASGSESDDDDDDWQVAAKSGMAARRRRRKDRRRAAWLAAAGAAEPPPPAAEGPADAGEAAPAAAAAAEPPAAGGGGSTAPPPSAGGSVGVDSASVGDGQGSPGEDSSESGGGREGEEAAGGSADEGSGGEGCDSSGEESEEGGRDGDAEESSVFSVTADFAMQNVILQMGLSLVAPNGLRVSHVRRFVLRCSACTTVTREAGRLFCPRCGNAAMEKVEVVIGPGGAEQFGVRKKHVLKGTRYSLPKPRGGKGANNPILREDQLLNNRGGNRSRRAAPAIDPFAPEYGPESWFRKNGVAPAHAKGAAVMLAGWRHNPNERKNVRTNRRS